MTTTIKAILTISLFLNIFFIILFTQESIFQPTKNLFRHIIYSNKIHTSHLREISIYDNNITISGLPFSSKTNGLKRLPKKIKKDLRPALWKLGTYPSGGRVRFKTNSKNIVLFAKTSSSTSHHMTSIMQNGIDIYIDNTYSGSAWPDSSGTIRKEFALKDNNTSLKNITLYLPLYSTIEIQKLYVGKDAIIKKADDLLPIAPIIYYGSSITQGASASNPGLSYPAIVSRNIQIDFINFGFSGNGLGDIEIAEVITSLDTSLIILDYWANPTSIQYKKSLSKFVAMIRKKKADIPILIITPFYNIGLEKQQKEKKQIIDDFIAQLKKYGDHNIYLIEGTKMLSKEQSSGLVDGIHLNSLGSWLAAHALKPKIIEILKTAHFN